MRALSSRKAVLHMSGSASTLGRLTPSRAPRPSAFATSLALAAPVSADLPVIDVSNLKQSILTAANTLKEVNYQIIQIQQFVQMLENEARDLLSLPFSALQQITSAIDQVNSLMRQAQSLAYDVARNDQQFEQLFPSYS